MPDQLLDNPKPVRQHGEDSAVAANVAVGSGPASDLTVNRSAMAERDQRRIQHLQATALLILAAATVLTLVYVAKLLLVVILLSILLSFVLAPIVDLMTRFNIPRALGALLAVLMLVIVLLAATYVSYSRALAFMYELPQYKARIQALGAKVREQAQEIQQTTETVLPSSEEDKKTVTVKQSSSWTDLVSKNASSVSEALLAITFIPFLVFFMLSWQDHVRSSSVMLFRMENRNTAYVMLGLIARMIRSFIVGNFIIGVFLSICSIALFGLMGLPYFYFLGVMSGFLSLIPYLGVILAVIPPLIADLGHLTTGALHSDHLPGHGLASGRHERALPQDSGQTPTAESAGGDSGPAVLGMAVGRDGTDSRRAHYRRLQNHLRSHRTAAALRSLAGRVRPLFAVRS